MTCMLHRKFAMITSSLLLLAFLFSTVLAASIPIDETASVTTVIDGSSFTINSGKTIKLAGIDTPQSGQPGFSEAKNYLTNMVQGKTVYLDIDSLATTDQNGRFMSVAYFDFNSSHYENVNMAMILNNYAAPSGLNNSEFNPSLWTWFVPKNTPSPSATSTPAATATPSVTAYTPPPTPTPTIPEFSALISLIIACLSSAFLVQLYKKKR
jgi:endonuclease YncB( thermonuclease family)